MLQKSSGILLHHFPHGENALILKLFTPEEGMQTFYYRRSRKNKQSGILQALSLVEVLAWHEAQKDFAQIRELRIEHSYKNIGRDVYRNSVVLFLNEILIKCLRESHHQQDLFLFLREWLIHFDQEVFDPDAHLYFLAHLSAYLGFLPNGKFSPQNPFFDLESGRFCSSVPLHPRFIEGHTAALFSSLFEEIPMDRKLASLDRKHLLNSMLEYLRVHVPNFGELRSLPVLDELFHS